MEMQAAFGSGDNSIIASVGGDLGVGVRSSSEARVECPRQQCALVHSVLSSALLVSVASSTTTSLTN